MRGSRNFCVGEGGGVQAPQLILQFTEGPNGFISHFPGGVHFFPGGGSKLLISIETHIHVHATITCDFPGGSGPYPTLDPQMYNVAFWHE